MDEKKDANLQMTTRVTFEDGAPFIETRVAPLAGVPGPIPAGKVLIVRTPILPPGASEAEVRERMEERLIDDDGGDPLYCPDCAADEGDGHAWLNALAGRDQRPDPDG